MLRSLLLPLTLPTRDGEITLRHATTDDLDDLMRLMSDDPVSAARGDRNDASDRPHYARALRTVIEDPANDIVVGADAEGRVIATLQLTLIPGLARRGATRLLVEAVRVASHLRSRGTGEAMMRWVMDVAAPQTGADLVQLTSDSARADAHRFYLRLGFTDSHIGFKYQVGA
ncbi:GNAT family N-acetyltransferase [Microbacterium nymphoidis]|uniref:GNAT family N-acetyltransferase n=1 Tax=Microbacterium nymphoidis TaxID=2898586 RepID=UPI001E6037CB|nr:GNAT family N-acetyltransferase [Microbacterium nymphoidis]MCD2496958.1 GNAT family N-acetyltransferase [Microbacterium nymphoidis]